MSLLVECKADEALARAIGISGRAITHFLGKGRVCARLARTTGMTGMIDEDPGSTAPFYFQTLTSVDGAHSVSLLIDKVRNNRVVVLSPRLEEWLVRSAKEAGLQMTNFGFGSDNGVQLHAEINHRLDSLHKLVEALREAGSQRLLRLQSLLRQS